MSSNPGNTMKITEGRLRSIIRDMILAEAPLVGDGIYRYEVSPEENKERGMPRNIYPSIAYNQSTDPAWIDEARVLMRNTAENWAIVSLSRSDYFADGPTGTIPIETPGFNKWIRAQNIPKGTRIIVIGSGNYPGDYENVAWAIGHDIFGHTLAGEAAGAGMLYFGGDVAGSGPYVNMLHARLPEIAKLAKDPTDLLADVFAAIFLKVVSREYFDEMLDAIPSDTIHDNVIDVLDSLFEIVAKWISSMPVDKPYVIAPW